MLELREAVSLSPLWEGESTVAVHRRRKEQRGPLYVFDQAAYIRNIKRLVDFTRGKLVAQILGTHIENTRTPYLDYMIGTKYQPDEHQLELGRGHLLELNDALQQMNGKVVRMALRDFTIWPVQR